MNTFKNLFFVNGETNSMSFILEKPFFESFNKLNNYNHFKNEGQQELQHLLIRMFNLDDVRFQYCSIDTLLRYLNATELKPVMENPDNPNEICLVSQIVKDGKLLANFPYILVGRDVRKYNQAKNLFTRVAGAVSHQLSLCYALDFQNTRLFFSSRFANLFVANCISPNTFDGMAFCELIETMERIANLTFEGGSISTGVIVTFDSTKYKKNSIDLIKPQDYRQLSKRDHFLVDGISSFYLIDQSFLASKIYFPDKETTTTFYNDYYQNYYIFNRIFGNDFIVRTLGHNEISVSDAMGKEFVKNENIWHYRFRRNFEELLEEELGLDERICKALQYYVLYCSRNHISSIIWIPNTNNLSKFTTSNRVKLWKQKINMLNPLHESLLKKLLASDGAIVVEKNGDIKYECVFAKMSSNSTKSKGNILKGSGESAAKILAQNGIAIKISQDGAIKICFGDNNWCY